MNTSNTHHHEIGLSKHEPVYTKACNVEIKFDHVNNTISVLKNNQSVIKVYNTNKSGNVFSDLNKILYLLEQ